METTIVIKLKTDGNVDITGPIHDKILCYGLLEVAKSIIKDYKPSPIIKPTNGDLKIIKEE